MASEESPATSSSPELHAPDHEPGTVSIRPILVILALLLLGLLGYAGYSCARSAGTAGSFTDLVAHYPPGSVTYLAAGRTYLVRAANGDFTALSEIESDRGDQIGGCVIRFRPDLQAAGSTGVFRDDCHGVLYDRGGRPLQGGGTPMQRHPVTQHGDSVQVQFGVCLGEGGDSDVQPCRE